LGELDKLLSKLPGRSKVLKLWILIHYYSRNKGNITTYHVESGKDFWKLLNGNPQNKNITPYDYSELTHNNPFRP